MRNAKEIAFILSLLELDILPNKTRDEEQIPNEMIKLIVGVRLL